jgi:hypothetical protein
MSCCTAFSDWTTKRRRAIRDRPAAFSVSLSRCPAISLFTALTAMPNDLTLSLAAILATSTMMI